MTRISQWAVRHPWFGLASWLLLVVIIGLLFTQFKGDYNDNFNLPESESTTAQELLQDLSGGAGTGSGLEGQVVWKVDSGKATDAAAAGTMSAVLTEVSQSPGVACVITPFGAPLGSACPPQQAPAGGGAADQGSGEAPELPPDALGPMSHFGQAGVSPDGTVAYATVLFEGESLSELPTEDLATALTLIKAANGQDGLTVGANGLFSFVQGEPPSSESIGVGVALFILLFAFGSILGAFLPIVSAALSVSISTALVLPIVANYFSVATFAPFLASMIGLGVGIDYSLFVINRYREAMRHGRDPRSAALESVRTSGRAVQFAALTVIIALLGPVRHADRVLQRHRRVRRDHGVHGHARRPAPAAGRALAARQLGVRRAHGVGDRRGGDPEAARDRHPPRPRPHRAIHRVDRLPPGDHHRVAVAAHRAPRQGAGHQPPQRLRPLRRVAAAPAVAAGHRRARDHADLRRPRAPAASGLLRRLRRARRQPGAHRLRPDRRGLRAGGQRPDVRGRAAARRRRPGRDRRAGDGAERRSGRRPGGGRPGRPRMPPSA